MHDPVLYLAGLIRRHLSEVCFGMTAVGLMLAGPVINGFIQRLTQKLHWLLRYLVFIIMCTAGYGVITQIVYRSVKQWLGYQTSVALVIITVIIYLALAFFAKKQGHI